MATSVAEYQALALWRKELAAGQRTVTTFDALWGAASEEASAREFALDRLPEIVERCLLKAAEIILEGA